MRGIDFAESTDSREQVTLSDYDDAIALYGQYVPRQQYHYPGVNGAYLVAVYNSGNFSERYSTVPLGTRVCHVQVLVPDPLPGDIIVASADGEVTSERNTNTEVVTQLMWTASSGAITGTEMCEENGQNVDIDMHHMKISNVGSIVVPAGTAKGAMRFVSWVLGAFDGNIQPQYIDVNNDYSRVVVWHYRPF